MRTCRLVGIGMLAVATTLSAQEAQSKEAGRRTLLPRDQEIALARSAAPASVSRGARIYVLGDTGYVVADSGTTGVACLVNRSWIASLEPECFDPEAARTLLPMAVERTGLLHRGVGPAEVDRIIADGLSSGRLQIPRRMAVVYMMSRAQQLISDDGRPAGNWKPHLMIHFPYLTGEDVGAQGAPDLRGGIVVNAGGPTANLMVVVPDFIDP